MFVHNSDFLKISLGVPMFWKFKKSWKCPEIFSYPPGICPGVWNFWVLPWKYPEILCGYCVSLQTFIFTKYSGRMWLGCWIPNPGVLCLKPLGGSKVDSAFHPSKVDQMRTRNFWELNGKK